MAPRPKPGSAPDNLGSLQGVERDLAVGTIADYSKTLSLSISNPAMVPRLLAPPPPSPGGRWPRRPRGVRTPSVTRKYFLVKNPEAPTTGR